ncbi:hypothetical protein [Azospirillum argentinense]
MVFLEPALGKLRHVIVKQDRHGFHGPGHGFHGVFDPGRMSGVSQEPFREIRV